MKIERYSTRWYGIYVELEGANYYIMDDNGCYEYFGDRHPTEEEVEQYASQTEYYNG